FISSVPPKQHNQRGQFLRYLTPSKLPNLSTTETWYGRSFTG
ncbi:hypothetical protein EDC31_1071, partial [Acidomonas methanolica]